MPTDPTQPDDTVGSIRAQLRRGYEGLLRAGEVLHRVRYVLDPITADPVMVVPPQAVEQHGDPAGGGDTGEVILHVPDDGSMNVHVLGHFQPLDPDRDAVCDRYLIYHGAPSGRENKPRWARLRVDSVKLERQVIDREEYARANPFHGDEPAFCKRMNQNRERTRTICANATGTLPESPLVVGVDPGGIDLRARLGVIRIEFDAPQPTLAAVEAELARLERGGAR